MPLATPPSGSIPLYARSKVTGETFLIGPSTGFIDDLGDVDTSTTGPTGGSALVWDETLQQWVPGSPAASEVEVDAVEPTGDWELWVDTGTQSPITSTQGIALDDLTDVDLSLARDVPADGDALIYDQATGMWLAGEPRMLPLAGGMMDSNAVISFPNEADKTKLLLYGTEAAGFGIGITSGSMTSYASSAFRFRQSALAGTEWATIEAAGIKSGGVWLPKGVQVDNLAITANAYYMISHCGRPAGVRWAFAAQRTDSGVLQTAAGTGSIRQAADTLVYSDVTVASQTVSEGGKLFNWVGWGFSSGNYGLYVRAGVTATVNVGCEVSNILNVDPTGVRGFLAASPSPIYDGVTL